MKVSMICTGKSSKTVIDNSTRKEIIMYSVDFGVKKERPGLQQYHGGIHLESQEPFHYKIKQEYSIVMSQLVTLADPNVIVPNRPGFGVNKNVN